MKQPVPLLGGPKDRTLVWVDPAKTYELVVPEPLPIDGKTWLEADDDLKAMLAPATMFRQHRYFMALVAEASRYEQWVLVHPSLHGPSGRVDPSAIDQDTMVWAIMAAWRATWADTRCKHCGLRIINRYRYGTPMGIQTVQPLGWLHADGPVAGMRACDPSKTPYGTVAAPR